VSSAQVTQPNVGLALGSGSLHGYAHLGVLKALEARGVRPGVVTGTSAGAIAGAMWAYGLSWEQVHRATMGLGWWTNQSLALDRGLLRNDAVGTLVARETHGVPIERWPTRFAAVATDFATGQRVLLSQGPAGPAVQASSSLPVLYSPVRLDGRWLVDGALSEPIPVRAARELGARRVIAVDVAYRPGEEPAPGLAGTPLHTVHILVNRLIDEQVKDADVAIRLDVHRWVDKAGHHDALIAAGERAVEERWDSIAALLGR
jgi:NTE family protein